MASLEGMYSMWAITPRTTTKGFRVKRTSKRRYAK